MSDIEYKKKTLNKLGISVLDGNYNNIFLKYNNNIIPYNTQSFIMYNYTYLITNICKLFRIDNMKDSFLENLNKKKKYLKKLRISRFWFNDEFYLEKNKYTIKYDFDDYVEMELDLFIADVKTKFNKLEAKKTFNESVSTNNNLSYKTKDNIIDVCKMKLNIKNIIIEKGLYKNE